MAPSIALAVGESCDTSACSNCTPPPIVQDGGGCPAGQYWIGDATSGFCRTSTTTCSSPQRFSCMSGGCTGQPAPSNTDFLLSDVTGITSGSSYAVKNVATGTCYTNSTVVTVNTSTRNVHLATVASPSPEVGQAIEIRSTSGTNCSGSIINTIPAGGTRVVGPLCGGDSSKVHLGGAPDNCATKVTVIQDPSSATTLKAWLGQILGNLVYIPTGTTCGTGDNPTWDAGQNKWTCAQGGGVWSKGGTSPDFYISNTNTGNVGIGTAGAPTAKLEVNGEIKGWGMVPVGTITSWTYPAMTNTDFVLTDVTGITSGNAYAVKNATTGVCYSNNTTVTLNGNKVHLSSAVGAAPVLGNVIQIRQGGGVPGFLCGSALPLINTAPIGGTRTVTSNPPLPSNWKVCDGSTVSDAASLFNGRALPNLAGQFIRGAKADYTDSFPNAWSAGGANNQTVDVPAHTHTVAAHSHPYDQHSHTMDHTHNLPAHAHTIASHTHTIQTHDHDLGGHGHVNYGHSHHWSGVNYDYHDYYDQGAGKWYEGLGYDINSTDYYNLKGMYWVSHMNGQDDGGGGITVLSKNENDSGYYAIYDTNSSGNINTYGPNADYTSSTGDITSGAASASTDTITPTTQGPSAANTSNYPASGRNTTGSATPTLTATVPATIVSSSYDNQPPFLNLVKIIRIK